MCQNRAHSRAENCSSATTAFCAKNRVYGKMLPANLVLVKLRAPGMPPNWVMLEREAFDREKHFRSICQL